MPDIGRCRCDEQGSTGEETMTVSGSASTRGELPAGPNRRGRAMIPASSCSMHGGTALTAPTLADDTISARAPERQSARAPERQSARAPERQSARAPERQSARAPERQSARAPERQSARAPERQSARAPERQSARAPERQSARAPERQSARAPERQSARAPERQSARAPERQSARAPERQSARAPERQSARAPERRFLCPRAGRSVAPFLLRARLTPWSAPPSSGSGRALRQAQGRLRTRPRERHGRLSPGLRRPAGPAPASSSPPPSGFRLPRLARAMRAGECLRVGHCFVLLLGAGAAQAHDEGGAGHVHLVDIGGGCSQPECPDAPTGYAEPEPGRY